MANLDADGVYWGVIEKRREDLSAEDFEVPKDCDLKPGKYKLNRDVSRIGGPGFDPLERSKQKAAPEAPNIERVLYDIVQQMGAQAPKSAIEWARWYEKTMDARKQG